MDLGQNSLLGSRRALDSDALHLGAIADRDSFGAKHHGMKLFASQGEHGVTIPLVVDWSLRPYLHTGDGPGRYCFLLINQRIGRGSEIIDEPAHSTGRPAGIH